MNVQLTLIDSSDAVASEWRIDDETREIGRAGLRTAREALAEARSALTDVAATVAATSVSAGTDDEIDTISEDVELPAAA